MIDQELRVWLQGMYEAFVLRMFRVLPDFPNCCYQVSGAVAQMLINSRNLRNIKVVQGSYLVGETNMYHGWVKAQTNDGRNLIIDFAHLQFEFDALCEGCDSFNQLLHSQLHSHVPFSGKVVFFENDQEYGRYTEMGGSV